MLNEEKELLAALLRLFIANPTGNPLTRGQMMDVAKVALDALTAPKPEPVAFLNAAELSRGVVAGEVDSSEWGPGMLAVYADPIVLADLFPGKKSLYDYEHVNYERFVSGIKAREWNACLAEVKRRLTIVDTPGEDYFAQLVISARERAAKAMRKFPQPNYVLNKVAEESGEVIKEVIHYTEGRGDWSKVEWELVDNLAMLIRLVTEGDQVIGFTPPQSAYLKAKSF